MRAAFLLTLAVAASAAHLRYAELYERVGVANSTDAHTVSIWMKLRENAAASCDTALMDVAHPESPNFLKHWSFDRMKEFADSEHVQPVLEWLRATGPHDFTVAPNSEYVTIRGSVAHFEKLFGLKLYSYRLRADGSVTAIAGLPTHELPSAIAAHVDFAAGFNRLPYIRVSQRTPIAKVNTAADGSASPVLIRGFYGIPNGAVADPRSTGSIFASLGQSFSPADLLQFQQQFGIQPTTIQTVSGPNTPSSCSADPNNCIEAELDTQQVLSYAQGANVSFYSVDSNAHPDIFLFWAQEIAANANPPLVHSISYGSLGPENPLNDMLRFNTEICKLGLRGLTVFVSSGDDGVANFGARSDPTQCGFTPSYPATSPYVTAVGATSGPEAGTSEVACTSDTGGLITTGGGFSDTFAMPAYQQAAVQNYIKTGPSMPPLTAFNTSGRAYPDVAFMGHNYPVVTGGQVYQVSGTSASSPAFASTMLIINGLRLAAGKAPIGFLNVILYQTLKGSGFKDVTAGRNNCCAAQSNPVCCQYGFTATSGWDPLTGWGTPDFQVLSRLLVAM